MSSLIPIFESLDIGMVIIIDDEYRVSIDAMLDTVHELTPPVDIPHFGLVDPDDPPELSDGRLRYAWEAATPTQRVQMYQSVIEMAVDSCDEPDQRQPLHLLQELIPQNIDFRMVSPEAWINDRTSLLDLARRNTAIVFLDRAIAEDSPDWGIRELSNLLADDANSPAFFVLLTNTIGTTDEYSEWGPLSEHSQIEPARFALLSKEHLSDDTSHFPEALRIALMANPASRLVSDFASVTAAVVEQSAQRIQSLKAPEVERLVFGLAKEEGISEIDMLMRLFQIHHRSATHINLLERSSVLESLTILRKLDECRADRMTATSAHSEEIFYDELYENRSYLCEVRSPLELGDIFEKEPHQCSDASSIRRYVLTAQPCDLMLRSDAKRSPELSYVTLLPIRRSFPKRSDPVFELRAFGAAGKPHWIHLGRPEHIPIEAVEYCVFAPDGRSVVPDVNNLPDWLLPHWKKRAQVLSDAVSKLKLAGLSHGNMERTIKARFGVRRECLVKPRIEEPTFSWGLRRIGRMLGPYPNALLSAYSAHQSRAAFDRPLVSKN